MPVKGCVKSQDSLPKISIIIPTYNRRSKLARLLKSILHADYPKELLEIIIVDDASKDGTPELVRRFIEEQGRIIRIEYIRHDKPYLIAKSRNDGILKASNELIFFIDDDNVVDKKAVKILAEYMHCRQYIGVAGPVTYYLREPNRIQYAGAIYSRFMRRTIFLYHNVVDRKGVLKGKVLEVDGIANSFMIRRTLALKAGLIPWKRIPWNGEDGYLQFKIKKMGYKVVVLGDAKVYHDVNPNDIKRYDDKRLYYAIRSKILFHRDLDSRAQFLGLLASLPAYVLWYLSIAIVNDYRLRRIKAVMTGLLDGLSNVEGLKYT